MIPWYEEEKMITNKEVAEPIVIDALFNNYAIPEGEIYDCKQNHLSKRIEELGRTLVSLFYNPDLSGEYHIISQPTWYFPQEEIFRELERLPHGCVACFLLKSTFIGGQKRFNDLFSLYPPKLILQFARRIKCKSGYSHNFAWFIWEKGSRTEPILRWINKFTPDN